VSCIETPAYSRLDVIVGQSVELLCNTSLTTDIMWTYDRPTSDGYVYYVYWRGHIDNDKPGLSVKTTGGNFHSLVISDVHLQDSGLYNCYDGEGLKKVGYQLIVNGMYWLITETHITLQAPCMVAPAVC